MTKTSSVATCSPPTGGCQNTGQLPINGGRFQFGRFSSPRRAACAMHPCGAYEHTCGEPMQLRKYPCSVFFHRPFFQVCEHGQRLQQHRRPLHGKYCRRAAAAARFPQESATLGVVYCARMCCARMGNFDRSADWHIRRTPRHAPPPHAHHHEHRICCRTCTGCHVGHIHSSQPCRRAPDRVEWTRLFCQRAGSSRGSHAVLRVPG